MPKFSQEVADRAQMSTKELMLEVNRRFPRLPPPGSPERPLAIQKAILAVLHDNYRVEEAAEAATEPKST
jgi:hypothetical protein